MGCRCREGYRPPEPPRAPLERFALLVVIIMIILSVIILNGWMVVAGGLPPPRTPPVYSAFGLVVGGREVLCNSKFIIVLAGGRDAHPPFTRPSASWWVIW